MGLCMVPAIGRLRRDISASRNAKGSLPSRLAEMHGNQPPHHTGPALLAESPAFKRPPAPSRPHGPDARGSTVRHREALDPRARRALDPRPKWPPGSGKTMTESHGLTDTLPALTTKRPEATHGPPIPHAADYSASRQQRKPTSSHNVSGGSPC